MDDVFSLKSTAFPDTTRVASFRGHEALSQLYEFELFLIVPGDDAKSFDFADAVGTKAHLSAHEDRKHPFTFHGILRTVELVHAHGTFALFRALLVPRLHRLALTRHSRIFTQQAFPDVLKTVLDESGLSASDVSLQLTGSYAAEEHICQYHESDLAFVSRWMEHLGIYYYFEHGDVAEKLIVTDASSSHTDLPTEPVRYVATLGGDRSAGEAIQTFRCRASSLPASVKLKDYDYTKPTLDVSATAPVASNGMGEISVYSARIFTPDDATRFAKLRAEELLAGQFEHFGSATMHLRAGYTFTLEEHLLDALNQKYLATRCEHFGNQTADAAELGKLIDVPFKDVYRCEVTAIPAKVQFRAERRTPWPRVYGLEHGLIDGEQDSDYAQLDESGRYRVKFFFDESALKDGKASTLVRMMQPHGGGVEGFHFPLRKGTEVLLSFLGGDPDRPVITGVVPNAHTPSPVTSGNNTTNVIQTGGRNRLEMEDKDGQQRITMSSPTKNSYIRFGAPNQDHNMIIQTDGPTLLHAGQSWDVTVGEFLKEQVTEYVDEDYGGYHKTLIGGTRDQTVKGAVTENYNTGQKTDVSGGPRVLDVTGDLKMSCSGTATEHYSTAHDVLTGPRTDTVKGTLALTSGARTDQVNGTYSLTATSPITITAPAKTENITGPVTWLTTATKTGITAGASATIDLSASIGLTVGASLGLFLGIKLSAEASLSISAAAGLKASFDGAVNLRESPIQVTLGGVNTTISGGAMVEFVTPCLMIPAASVVIV